MNKELTAMQMLIEELSQRKDINTVRMVIAMIKANYLQKEQEQIEKAFEDGIYSGKVFNKPIQGKDYYQSKYGGEDA